MLFMVVEHFRNDDAVPVYRRFREQGRLAPTGLNHVSSWVTSDLTRCFSSGGRAPYLEQWHQTAARAIKIGPLVNTSR